MDVSSKEAIYESVLIFATILILALSTIDMFFIHNLTFTKFVEILDLIICAAFATDLFLRYKKSKQHLTKLQFIKSNFIELFAIIPLDVAFRAFRLVRIFRLARLSRLSRLGRVGNLMLKFINKFANPSYLRYKRFKTLIQAKGMEEEKVEKGEDVKE